MASILSSVPPVWPRPRPDIIGTYIPAAANRGAKTKETQSPNPPVECLSRTGPSKFHDSVLPLSRIARVKSFRPLTFKPLRQTAIAKAAPCASDTEKSASPLQKLLSSAVLGVSPAFTRDISSLGCNA